MGKAKSADKPTMSSVMRELLSQAGQDGRTPRHKICSMMIDRAIDGDAEALKWVERVSGDGGEESRRVERETSPFSF